MADIGRSITMAEIAKNLEYFKVCSCCGEPFSTGQHYLNSVDILPGGIDFQKGFLWANCICGTTHLVKLELYPEHIRGYLNFLVTNFREKYGSEVKADEGEEPTGAVDGFENREGDEGGPS